MAGGPLRLTLNPGRAAEVIGRQFPHLAGLAVTPLGAGGDHHAFAVGRRWVFRFPKRAGEGHALLAEARLLDWLAPRLPLPVPVVAFVGEPSGAFPETFTGAARLTGRSGLDLPDLQLEETGRVLGRFLRALHANDREAAWALGLEADFVPGLSDWRDAALEDAGAVADHLPDLAAWRGVLGQPPAHPPERLTVIHGDLAAEHVLFGAGGEITGLLDWADATVGDPARDLAGLIHWGGRVMLDAALGEYGAVDAGFVHRAAWYAACRAVGDLAFGVGRSGRNMCGLENMRWRCCEPDLQMSWASDEDFPPVARWTMAPPLP